jgi:hypothetical protein
MIRKFIYWLMYLLHIKKMPPEKSTLEVVLDLTPSLFAVILVTNLFKHLVGDLRLPWYKRILYRVRYFIIRLRVTVVGF